MKPSKKLIPGAIITLAVNSSKQSWLGLMKIRAVASHAHIRNADAYLIFATPWIIKKSYFTD